MDIEELHKIECHALPGSGLAVRTVSVDQLLKHSNRTVNNVNFLIVPDF